MNINISEQFLSIQGEGSTAGRKAVFVRTQACNLMCGGYGTEKDGELHGGAEWRCDTIEVWRQGEPWTTDRFRAYLLSVYDEAFKNGAMIVWTGGEPLLQQKAIYEVCNKIMVSDSHKTIRHEVETNGTIMPDDQMVRIIDQWNVSPKLSNSGMPWHKRYKADVLTTFRMLGDKVCWKFVVTSERDMAEINEIVERIDINPNHVWLMPGVESREQWYKESGAIASLASKYQYNFSPRLQVILWDQVTGV